MKVKKRGGKRKNAGRKPLPSEKKRKSITIFPKQESIDSIGGEDEAKRVALEAIEV